MQTVRLSVSLLTTHPKQKILSCPCNSTHSSTCVAENLEKLNGEVVNGRLFARWDGHREVHDAQEGVRVIVLGGSGVWRGEDFIINVGLGKIGNAKESLGILVFNSYIVGEQIVGVQSLPDLEARMRLAILRLQMNGKSVYVVPVALAEFSSNGFNQTHHLSALDLKKN